MKQRRHLLKSLLLASLLVFAQQQLLAHELQEHLFGPDQVSSDCLHYHVQASALAVEPFHLNIVPAHQAVDQAFEFQTGSGHFVAYRSRAPPQAHSL